MCACYSKFKMAKEVIFWWRVWEKQDVWVTSKAVGYYDGCNCEGTGWNVRAPFDRASSLWLFGWLNWWL